MITLNITCKAISRVAYIARAASPVVPRLGEFIRLKVKGESGTRLFTVVAPPIYEMYDQFTWGLDPLTHCDVVELFVNQVEPHDAA